MYLTSEDFFYLKELSNFPKFTKIKRKRARFEKKPTCPFPNLVHPFIFYLVGKSHFLSFSFFVHDVGMTVSSLCSFDLSTILYTMMPNTLLDAWPESDKLH